MLQSVGGLTTHSTRAEISVPLIVNLALAQMLPAASIRALDSLRLTGASLYLLPRKETSR
jgi:hypothetical protein